MEFIKQARLNLRRRIKGLTANKNGFIFLVATLIALAVNQVSIFVYGGERIFDLLPFLIITWYEYKLDEYRTHIDTLQRVLNSLITLKRR